MNVTRQQIEDFLYEEAEILDTWNLTEWPKLFVEEGAYYIPATDSPNGDHRNTLYIVSDDYVRINERVKRLLKKEAHVEYPHSRTNHSYTNVRIKEIKDGVIHVACNFIIYRTKREVLDTYVGHCKYQFVLRGDRLKILEKRVQLDLDALRPQGKVSIIL